MLSAAHTLEPLTLAQDKDMDCFLWDVNTLPQPKFNSSIAKSAFVTRYISLIVFHTFMQMQWNIHALHSVLIHDDVINWKHIPRCWPFVNGDFPAQRPVTRSFDVFFDLRPNKRLGRWAGDLRRHRAHYDVIVMWMSSRGTWGPWGRKCE